MPKLQQHLTRVNDGRLRAREQLVELLVSRPLQAPEGIGLITRLADHQIETIYRVLAGGHRCGPLRGRGVRRNVGVPD